MNKKPKKEKGIFTKGMSFRVIYQGVMIGFITLAAFIIGLATPSATTDAEKIQIGQTMAFCVLALSELVHVFNIRDNKKSIFKGGLFSNSKLILATIASAGLMFIVLLVPALRNIFNIAMLPKENILETILLVFSPIAIVEIFKLLKINTTKDE